MDNRAIVRQFTLNFAVTLAVIFVLLKADLVGYVAYSVERGRLKALRETLPTAAQVAEASLPARDVARTALPGVVFIETEVSARQVAEMPLEDLLERFGALGDDEDAQERRRFIEEHVEEQRRDIQRRLERMGPRLAMGSGFITDADNGFIVTNHHVIEAADRIEVLLSDGRRFVAKVIGDDPLTDLAVIQIEADRLHELPFGDSDGTEVGDEVFSLGSPFGLTGTVSRGIISGKGRSSINVGRVLYRNFLQTDAVINPGNSGGPLVNLRGEVVGVNTAIATQTGDYNGVGFAIPSSRVLRVLPKLMRGEPIVRAFLGVAPQSVTDNNRRAAELGWSQGYGVVINQVTPESGAEAAGVRVDDILLRMDGHRLQTAYQMIEMIGQMPPEAMISLDLWRNGRELTVKAKLGSRTTQ